MIDTDVAVPRLAGMRRVARPSPLAWTGIDLVALVAGALSGFLAGRAAAPASAPAALSTAPPISLADRATVAVARIMIAPTLALQGHVTGAKAGGWFAVADVTPAEQAYQLVTAPY